MAAARQAGMLLILAIGTGACGPVSSSGGPTAAPVPDTQLPASQRRRSLQIPHHKIEWLPQAGHFAFLDQPDQVLAKIDTFLRPAN